MGHLIGQIFHHAAELSDPGRVEAALVKTCTGGGQSPNERQLGPEFKQNDIASKHEVRRKDGHITSVSSHAHNTDGYCSNDGE